MVLKKRGGQPANQNAVTHGRYSAPVRAVRLAAWEEQQRRSAEWMKRMPQMDHAAIVDGLRALKQRKVGRGKQMSLGQQLFPALSRFKCGVPQVGRCVQRSICGTPSF